MPGLISTMNIAKKGMDVQQKNIQVTSHNISNVETKGYSRQVAKVQTTRPFCTPSMDSSVGPGQFGTGAEVTSVDRIRDFFLDYQVRHETSIKGEYDFRNKFLKEIEGILNEPSDKGISTLITKFFNSWQDLADNTQSSHARTGVVSNTVALTDELNHTYKQLQKLKKDVQENIKQNLFDSNNLLNQINSLNQEIIQIKVAGNNPNDLEDKRDLLIDELSEKFNINVDRSPNFNGEDISPVDAYGIGDGKLVKSLYNDNVKRFSYVSGIEDTGTNGTNGEKIYKITYYKNADMSSDVNRATFKMELTQEEYEKLDQCRILWSSKDGVALKNGVENIKDGSEVKFENLNLFEPTSGQLGGQISIQHDIADYMGQFNRLAKGIAFSINALHSGMKDATAKEVGSQTPDKDYVPFFVNDDEQNKESSNIDSLLAAEKNITAGNITINKEIRRDGSKIKTKAHDDRYKNAEDNDVDGSNDNTRALAIAGLKNTLTKIQDIDENTDRKAFIGELWGKKDLGINTIKNDTNGMKIDSYFKDVVDRIAVQTQEAGRIVKNQESLLNQFQETRDSISGVSINEEISNLIQYQHAYSASAKVLSTIDQLLDVLINGIRK